MHTIIRSANRPETRVSVRWSVFPVAVLVTATMAVAALPGSAPGYPAPVYWLTGVVVGALFVGSITVHELGHALAGRWNHMPVREIVVSLWGGETVFQDDPPTPRTEFLISAAGPVTNIAVSALSVVLVAATAAAGVSPLVVGTLVWLAIINAALALLNLLPGRATDGGQMLFALLWQRSGDRARALSTAAHAGRTFGTVVLGAGIMLTILNGLGSGLWLAFLGFLFARSNS